MASTHKSLRSSTANKRPTTAIADGQIALNTNSASPGLFFKDSTGATIIKIGPVHVGTTAPNATPGAGGSSGNSTGEIWLDTSLTPVGVKIWTGSAFVNATPIGSTTVQGLLELATDAETQTGSDTNRAVTPAGLQSKLSDSTSTTSSTTIASSTAAKAAYDLAALALPKTGGTVTGNLEIGTTGTLSFEGAAADAFETTIAVVDPTADRTITLPNVTGTIVTTGDTGTVTSTMLLDGTLLNADVNASAAIAGTKISPDFGSQTVTSSGRFLVGDSSTATGGFAQYAKLRVKGSTLSSNVEGIFSLLHNLAAASIPLDEGVGTITFAESSGGEYARIRAFCDGAGGSNDFPGRLVFSTTVDGASSPTERMRISNDGTVTVGGTVTASAFSCSGNGFTFANTSGGPADTQAFRSDLAGNNDTTFVGWRCYSISAATRYCAAFHNTNGVVGSITTSGSATAYNTSSDYRLKENVTDIVDSVDRLMALSPRRFNFIADPDKTVDGFIAHEAQAVVPECVTGEKDAVDDDGNPVYQGIDQSKLVPLLTAALQKALAEIDALKDRVAALEDS